MPCHNLPQNIIPLKLLLTHDYLISYNGDILIELTHCGLPGLTKEDIKELEIKD